MYSVLLVDDEPHAIEGLQLFVDWRKLGFRICGVCENGEEALDTAARLAPDVVMTDIRMPEMDGLELIGKMQESGRPAPEFVILSAYSEFSYAKRAMQLGIHDYLLKPVMEEEATTVLRRVRERLEQRRAAFRYEQPIPLEALRGVRRILEAIEALEADEAGRLVRALTGDAGADEEAWLGVMTGHLAVQCAKLIQQYGGDSSALNNAADTGSAPERMQAIVTLTMETLREWQARKPGSTLSAVDQFIREHYRDSLSVKEVAARFYLNPVYLGKAYQDKFGCTLLERMHSLRIEEAKRLLLEADCSVARIAEQVGYAHYHHFLQHFEKRTNMKPAAYRAARQAADHDLST